MWLATDGAGRPSLELQQQAELGQIQFSGQTELGQIPRLVPGEPGNTLMKFLPQIMGIITSVYALEWLLKRVLFTQLQEVIRLRVLCMKMWLMKALDITLD